MGLGAGREGSLQTGRKKRKSRILAEGYSSLGLLPGYLIAASIKHISGYNGSCSRFSKDKFAPSLNNS